MYSRSKRSRSKREGEAGHNILHNFGNLFFKGIQGFTFVCSNSGCNESSCVKIKNNFLFFIFHFRHLKHEVGKLVKIAGF